MMLRAAPAVLLRVPATVFEKQYKHAGAGVICAACDYSCFSLLLQPLYPDTQHRVCTLLNSHKLQQPNSRASQLLAAVRCCCCCCCAAPLLLAVAAIIAPSNMLSALLPLLLQLLLCKPTCTKWL
jgi:hypothetical protein